MNYNIKIDSNNKEKSKKTCSSCGENKNTTEFYGSNSPFYGHTGRISTCKECFCKYINDDIDKLKIALRIIDKPFLIDLLQNSREEAKRTNKNLIKNYMRNVSMPPYKNLTWDNSDNLTNNNEIMSFDEFKIQALHKLQRQFLSISDTKDTVLTRKNIIEMIKDLKEIKG